MHGSVAALPSGEYHEINRQQLQMWNHKPGLFQVGFFDRGHEATGPTTQGRGRRVGCLRANSLKSSDFRRVERAEPFLWTRNPKRN